jgi:hypothetical protein
MFKQSKSVVSALLTEQMPTQNANTKDWVNSMEGKTLLFTDSSLPKKDGMMGRSVNVTAPAAPLPSKAG